jgi:hypothetical protein
VDYIIFENITKGERERRDIRHTNIQMQSYQAYYTMQYN